MTHGDDEGMIVPPVVAPYQIVIVPLLKDKSKIDAVMDYAKKLKQALSDASFKGERVRVKLDDRQKESVDKMWEWTRKGTPLVIEVGPRDMENNALMVRDRTKINLKEWKEIVSFDAFVASVTERLANIQNNLLKQAEERLNKNIKSDIQTPEEFEKYFSNQNVFVEGEKKSVTFVRGKWSGDNDIEEKLKSMKINIRCIPFEQSGTEGVCLITGKPATIDVIYARSY